MWVYNICACLLTLAEIFQNMLHVLMFVYCSMLHAWLRWWFSLHLSSLAHHVPRPMVPASITTTNGGAETGPRRPWPPPWRGNDGESLQRWVNPSVGVPASSCQPWSLGTRKRRSRGKCRGPWSKCRPGRYQFIHSHPFTSCIRKILVRWGSKSDKCLQQKNQHFVAALARNLYCILFNGIFTCKVKQDISPQNEEPILTFTNKNGT